MVFCVYSPNRERSSFSPASLCCYARAVANRLLYLAGTPLCSILPFYSTEVPLCAR